MRNVKRVVAACLIVVMGVQATGCHTWRAVTEPVPAAVARYPNRKVQVIGPGGGVSTAADSARVVADALLAFHRDRTDTIPLAEVEAVKVLLLHAGRSMGLFVGITALCLAAGWVVAFSIYMDREGMR